MSERCAVACLRRGDPATATAPPVRFWLLVEQPGPWGAHPWRDSPLPASVVSAIADQAAAAHARVLLIRRPGRARSGTRRWALVDSLAERSWWTPFDDPAELVDLRLDDRAGEPSTEPLFLVCAHGGHDACCAIMGRPLAAALSVVRPEQTWECTHVGGDRFAPNLLVLPHGLLYGQVPPERGPVIADLHDDGLVDVVLLRGRTTDAAPAQAARRFAMQRYGDPGIGAFAPLSVDRVGTDVWDVRLADVGTVRVRACFDRSDTPLTCSATAPAAIRRFEVLAWPTRAPG